MSGNGHRNAFNSSRADLDCIWQSSFCPGLFQAMAVALGVSELQRIGFGLEDWNIGPLTLVEGQRQALERLQAHVMTGAWDHPLVSLNVLLEHHLPGARALDPEVVRRIPLEQDFDLGRDIGNPAHAAFLPYLPARHRPRECSRSATPRWTDLHRPLSHSSQIRGGRS
jgi:hypothetical protein